MRVFWLGAHKVLKRTELRLLRQMGIEAFNPPYISPVYDQSMDRRIDIDQLTTLPAEVFATLITHDFFYTQVPESIAEILNAYFDAIIVTINPDWLISILRVFTGKVIWRIYGQPHILSDYLITHNYWATLAQHPDLRIVPFAAESIEREHPWFIDLCQEAVPYQIPDEVFDFSGVWQERSHKREIAVSIPNIDNPYYADAYSRFSSQFKHRVFRIYGPQRSTYTDRRVVGALDRNDFLTRLAMSAGYYYIYKDDVCYLPPIEMMEIGGPVIYDPGSLLARFYGPRTPGLVEDKEDAEQKIRRLLQNDTGFIGEVIAAQDSVRARYDRKLVEPRFREAFARLISASETETSRITYAPPYVVGAPSKDFGNTSTSRAVTICILLHIDGLFQHFRGRVYSSEGIPRVIDTFIEALVKHSNYKIIVTCTELSAPALRDLFAEAIKAQRLKLRIVHCSGMDGPRGNLDKLWLIEDLNCDTSIAAVLIPHYYLFPEALALTIPSILYLPDYFPHVMPDQIFDSSREKDTENKAVGVAIAKRASFIITNSPYTKGYLPDAGFVETEAIDKVVVTPLPLLGGSRSEPVSDDWVSAVRSRIADRRYIFYPTANRPNKQFAFLLRLFAAIRIKFPDLALVLTGDLDSVAGVRDVAERFNLYDGLVLTSKVDEGSLRWLYENAALLCLTSTLEGNFPPQVVEALIYRTPVVATRLVTITEHLGKRSASLLLCSPVDIDDFQEKISFALAQPELVRARQDSAVAYLHEHNTVARFYSGLRDSLDALVKRNELEDSCASAS